MTPEQLIADRKRRAEFRLFFTKQEQQEKAIAIAVDHALRNRCCKK